MLGLKEVEVDVEDLRWTPLVDVFRHDDNDNEDDDEDEL